MLATVVQVSKPDMQTPSVIPSATRWRGESVKMDHSGSEERFESTSRPTAVSHASSWHFF